MFQNHYIILPYTVTRKHGCRGGWLPTYLRLYGACQAFSHQLKTLPRGEACRHGNGIIVGNGRNIKRLVASKIWFLGLRCISRRERGERYRWSRIIVEKVGLGRIRYLFQIRATRNGTGTGCQNILIFVPMRRYAWEFGIGRLRSYYQNSNLETCSDESHELR